MRKHSPESILASFNLYTQTILSSNIDIEIYKNALKRLSNAEDALHIYWLYCDFQMLEPLSVYKENPDTLVYVYYKLLYYNYYTDNLEDIVYGRL